MDKIIIMGSGAAPGVPSVALGWGRCCPDNPKNRRRRIGTYIDIKGKRLLIDTSPDLRQQLLDNQIRHIDAVLYTHAHADHLHGIDDLRELNRISRKPLNVYAQKETAEEIRNRFAYLISSKDTPKDPLFQPSLILNEVKPLIKFDIGGLSIVPLELEGHAIPSIGYMIDGGRIVYISDCKKIPETSLDIISSKPQILILPLTCAFCCGKNTYHMGLNEVLEYAHKIGAHQTIINHMAVECDYDEINALTPENVTPAYDNMVIEF